MSLLGRKVLLIGEPMGLFISEKEGPLEEVESFAAAVCGAELNTAVGLRRLGQDVSYMTKLGDDYWGRRIAAFAEKNDVSSGYISLEENLHTGYMFKGKVSAGDPPIHYCRKGSAASTLSERDIDNIDFSEFDLVWVTGITPALSESCLDACTYLQERANEAGCLFGFDPNLRLQLWPDKEFMKEYLNDMAAGSDLFMPGINEGEILMGSRNPEKIANYYLDRGTGLVIVKNGSNGAYYASKDGSSGSVPGFAVEKVVDTVGAGDGFAAGVISGLREGCRIYDSVRRGCAVGAIQVMSKGDNDGLPSREQLMAFMDGDPNWRGR